jgi:pectate lyase
VSQEPPSGSPSTGYTVNVERHVCAGGLMAVAVIFLTGGCDVRIAPFRNAMTDAGPGTDGPPSGSDGSLPIPCPDEMVGFATTNGGTVGGGSGTPVVVSASDPDAFTQLAAYANEKMPGPLVIEVVGMIAFPGPDDSGASETQIRVSKDKTIIGSGAGSGLTGGGLNLTGSSNVILKNLVISKAHATDAISLNASTNIWIDHCDLSSDRSADAGSYDGLVDITHASDFVTISWTRYHDHDDTGIIGHSDSNGTQDTGFLHVTYHHDLFTNVTAGPRVRFGSVHIFNVYFQEVGQYGAASTMGALVLVDDSYFKNIPAPASPLTTMLADSAAPGYFWLPNNVADSTDGANNLTTLAMQWTPPYSYTPDSVASVPALVAACAGTGKTSPTPRD